MIVHVERLRGILFALAFGSLAAGCGAAPSPGMQPLPAAPPEPHRLDFTESGAWPPVVKDRTNVRTVPWTAIPGSLTDEREAALRAAALRDPAVQGLLGARYAYITADEVEPPKGQPGAMRAVRLTFFSHANNTAILVQMRGEQVQRAERAPGLMPPEGAAETRLAIALARRDPRLAGRVAGLLPAALVTFPAEGEPGYGDRVLYVAFSSDADGPPAYSATVDLTTGAVLRAGRAAGWSPPPR